MRRTVFGERGQRYRESRRAVGSRRIRVGTATSLGINLDEVAVWPRDAADDDLTYTSAIGRAGPQRDCPCGYGTAVHSRYCLDCDRAGLDGPLGYRPPPGKPGRWHPNEYPGIAPDLTADQRYVGEDRPKYLPPIRNKVTRKEKRERERAAARAG